MMTIYVPEKRRAQYLLSVQSHCFHGPRVAICCLYSNK